MMIQDATATATDGQVLNPKERNNSLSFLFSYFALLHCTLCIRPVTLSFLETFLHLIDSRLLRRHLIRLRGYRKVLGVTKWGDALHNVA